MTVTQETGPQDGTITIGDVEAGEDLEAVKQLFRAYADWLDIDLGYQGFEEELAGMPGKYAPPGGALLLAKGAGGTTLGCVGLRPMAETGVCEMKRLYVAPEGRGLGVGQALVDLVVRRAEDAGYRLMRLDTLPTMQAAIRIYRTNGFREIPAYYDTPIDHTVFFEKVL